MIAANQETNQPASPSTTAPAPADSILLPVPEFSGHENGFYGGIQFGNLRIVDFSTVIRQIDPAGILRQQILDALNNHPGLRAAMVNAALSRAPGP